MLVDIWRNKKSMSVQKTIFFFFFFFFFFFWNIIFIEKSGHGVIGFIEFHRHKRKKKKPVFYFYFKYWIPVVKNFIWISPCTVRNWSSIPIDLERFFLYSRLYKDVLLLSATFPLKSIFIQRRERAREISCAIFSSNRNRCGKLDYMWQVPTAPAYSRSFSLLCTYKLLILC